MAELVPIGVLATPGGGSGGPVTAEDISNSTPVGRGVLKAADQAAARGAIGAKADSYQPAAADISNATTVGRNVLTASNQAAARGAIGAAAAGDIPTDKVSGVGVTKVEKITRTAYDALVTAGTTVATTLYVISGA